MNIEELIGDTPVSAQINMAIKNHTHTDYATREEVADLKRKIELLVNLIGDTPVSEQIYAAIKNSYIL